PPFCANPQKGSQNTKQKGGLSPVFSAQRMSAEQRCAENQQRAGLMRGGERNRHREQQGRDSQRDLQRERSEQEISPELRALRYGVSPDVHREPGDEDRKEPRDQAVIELHGRDVVREVEIPGLEREHFRRDQTAVHE